MKLKNWFFRQLVERGLIKEKYEYYTDAEKRTYDQMQEELRKLEAGEEIRPPWRGSPSWNNPARFVGNSFNEKTWDTFWERLNDEGKREYIRKHEPSPEDWYQVYVKARTLGGEDEKKWLVKQKKKLESQEEIEPPWITFPISLPSVGWDDYFLEGWKLEIWIPFWDGLSEDEKKKYLEQWNSPDEEWKENITKNWTGKLRKTDAWLERQKMFLEHQDDYFAEPLLLPRYVFPKIQSSKTIWDEKFIDQWMTEVWLPFWNSLSDEKQDEHLKYIEFQDEEEMKWLEKYEVKNFYKFKNLKGNESK